MNGKVALSAINQKLIFFLKIADKANVILPDPNSRLLLLFQTYLGQIA